MLGGLKLFISINNNAFFLQQNERQTPMETSVLNALLTFIEADFKATEKLPIVSGQREVFYGTYVSRNTRCVMKICPTNPISVGRIQREIRILKAIDSQYFPKFFYHTFISETSLSNFLDNFDVRDDLQRKMLAEIRDMKLKPFLLTAEENIEHIPWGKCIEDLRNESLLVNFLIHLFRALALLWETQIAHRDLKPDNILLRADLTPVIIDLGIAKSFRPGTQEFTFFGSPCTPRYAAPEQLANKKTEITYKTDQFAIGVIAYFILTNHFPYGDVCEIGEKVFENFSRGIFKLREFNPSINEQLAKFIEQLLQVHPYKRFRNVETILQRLNEIKESQK